MSSYQVQEQVKFLKSNQNLMRYDADKNRQINMQNSSNVGDKSQQYLQHART